MFILESAAQLEKAIVKAKKTRTQVKFIKFGVYSVKGTQGNFYTVECKRGTYGEKIVSCDCKAGQSGKPLVCFHSVAALSLHVGLARQRQAAQYRKTNKTRLESKLGGFIFMITNWNDGRKRN